MKANELINMLVRSANSQTNVRFLYGQRELHLVQLEGTVPYAEGESEVVLCLDELRDLSDNEKHEG